MKPQNYLSALLVLGFQFILDLGFGSKQMKTTKTGSAGDKTAINLTQTYLHQRMH